VATFVLLHGGWDGAWFWRPVARLLQKAGHEVFTPTLTGYGERVHLASPEIGLDTHVQDVLGVLTYEDLHQVILVGYSYSGMVITAVAEEAPERLAHLVYCDAFVPQDGQSLKDMVVPEQWASFEAVARERGDGWRIPFAFQPRSTPNLLKPLCQPVTLGNPLAARLPRTYIYCTDKSHMQLTDVPLARSAAYARAQGWRYRELATGHAPMQTTPHELTALLLDVPNAGAHHPAK
jgi:pimeloyl-ACP methyl ester carboxylesterase